MFFGAFVVALLYAHRIFRIFDAGLEVLFELGVLHCPESFSERFDLAFGQIELASGNVVIDHGCISCDLIVFGLDLLATASDSMQLEPIIDYILKCLRVEH